MFRSSCMAALLLACAPWAVALPGQPVTSPDAAAQGFVEAWNSHDARNFSALFTDDAWWVPVVETRLSGKEQIVADLQQAHSSWARRTTMSASDVVVSPVSDATAIVLFHAGFLGRDGQRMEPPNALLLVLVKTADGWRIKAGQLTKPGTTTMAPK